MNSHFQKKKKNYTHLNLLIDISNIFRSEVQERETEAVAKPSSRADDAADIANSDNDKPDKAAQTVQETEVGGANTEHQSQDCKHCFLGVRPPVRYKNYVAVWPPIANSSSCPNITRRNFLH